MNPDYLMTIVRATRASARALADIQTWSRYIAEHEREGDSASAARCYRRLCMAQRRYAKAQAVLAAHPLPGDR